MVLICVKTNCPLSQFAMVVLGCRSFVLEKFALLKKGIGIESERVCKKGRDQIVWKQVEDVAQGCYRRKMNFKAFAVHILTTSSLWLTITL